jgi:hypothetical protein
LQIVVGRIEPVETVDLQMRRSPSTTIGLGAGLLVPSSAKAALDESSCNAAARSAGTNRIAALF